MTQASDQDNLNLSARAGETESMSVAAVPVPPADFQEFLADLRDWKLNTSQLADVLQTLWDAATPAPALTAGPGIVIDQGVISAKVSADADNAVTLGSDQGLFADLTP